MASNSAATSARSLMGNAAGASHAVSFGLALAILSLGLVVRNQIKVRQGPKSRIAAMDAAHLVRPVPAEVAAYRPQTSRANNASGIADLAPFPSFAYEELFVSKRLPVVDPSGNPVRAHSQDARNNTWRPDCQAGTQ